MENKKTKIISAGHICIDITPVFPAASEAPLGELLSPGKLIHMDPANIHTGGSVANTGLALKVLGADVSLMGKIGSDDFGKLILNVLNEYDAAGDMIISDDSTSSYTLVVAPIGVDRIFLHHTGANDSFGYDDLDFDKIASAGLFHFGYPPLMRSMYIHGGAELIKIFKKVSSMGVATSLDMAAVDSTSDAGLADWRKILADVLPYVDFFVPSVEEIAFMLDRELYNDLQKRAKGKDITSVLRLKEDIAPLADELIALGAKAVLLKCGAPGMYFKTASIEKLKPLESKLQRSFEGWGDKAIFERSYVPDRVLSGTGAGDTSIAAFLKAILDGYSLEDCLHLCTATGASCVAAYDALSGLHSFPILLEKISSGWKKQYLIS